MHRPWRQCAVSGEQRQDAPAAQESWFSGSRPLAISRKVGYSHLDYSFTPRQPAGTPAEYRSPGGGSRELRRQLRILRDFIDSFDFTRMAPHNELIEAGRVQASLRGTPAQARVTTRVLAEPGKAYAVYVLGGHAAELSLKLPAGSYRAEWIDTKTGLVAQTEQFEHSGGIRKMEAPPYKEDIALQIVQ